MTQLEKQLIKYKRKILYLDVSKCLFYDCLQFFLILVQIILDRMILNSQNFLSLIGLSGLIMWRNWNEIVLKQDRGEC